MCAICLLQKNWPKSANFEHGSCSNKTLLRKGVPTPHPVPSLRIIPTRERRVQQCTTMHCTTHLALCHVINYLVTFCGGLLLPCGQYMTIFIFLTFTWYHYSSLQGRGLEPQLWVQVGRGGEHLGPPPRFPSPVPWHVPWTQRLQWTWNQAVRWGGSAEAEIWKYFVPRDFVMSKRHRLTSYIAFHRYKIARYQKSPSTDVFYLLQLWE